MKTVQTEDRQTGEQNNLPMFKRANNLIFETETKKMIFQSFLME